MGDVKKNYSSNKDEEEENELDNEDEEDENELPQIPLNLEGPKEVNVDNSQVKIGNTVNVNFSFVVKSDLTNELIQGCSTQLPGLLTNLLINKPSQAETHKIPNESSGDVFPLSITYREHHSTDSSNLENVALIPCSSNDDTHSPNSVKVDSQQDVKKSHIKNDEFSATGNDLPLNNGYCSKEESDISNSSGFTKQFDEGEVTVDSLINEFVKSVNVYLSLTDKIEIDVPSISGDIDIIEMNSGTGKVKGLFPLTREEGIEVDLTDNLLLVSIPLKLEHLQITFERFSVGWNGISQRSTLKVTIVENSILINLSYAVNANGYSENDVTVEINLERPEIDTDSNFIANEILARIVKKKIKNYLKSLSVVLRNYYTENIKCVLECNDICAKLASIYMYENNFPKE